MIDDNIISKSLDVSDIEDYNTRSRRIIWHIYAIRNYFKDEDDKEIISLICNKRILEYISKYNFIPLKKDVNFDNLTEGETIGYLINLEIIYTTALLEDELMFNTKDDYNVLKIKIKF